MPTPPDPPSGGLYPADVTTGEPLPRLLPRWIWGLAGIGLFLAGAILGAVLMVSVALYNLPAAPTAPTAPMVTAAPPPATLPVVHSPVPTNLPLPTRPPVGPGIGQEAPPFVLSSVEGITYTLDTYRGKTVLLSFWASWCPPCRQEWPELRAFAADLTATQVVVLAVNVEETSELIIKFVGTETVSFPILLDSDGQISERYHVSALPTTFLIDPAGLVRQVVPGNMDAAMLRRLIHP
jgi:peroxiredoxin